MSKIVLMVRGTDSVKVVDTVAGMSIKNGVFSIVVPRTTDGRVPKISVSPLVNWFGNRRHCVQFRQRRREAAFSCLADRKHTKGQRRLSDYVSMNNPTHRRPLAELRDALVPKLLSAALKTLSIV